MKVEINSRKKAGKFTNMWKVNSTRLNNQWVKKEIQREIRKYLQTNENKYTIHHNLWDAVNTVLRGKFMVIDIYIKKKKELK